MNPRRLQLAEAIAGCGDIQLKLLINTTTAPFSGLKVESRVLFLIAQLCSPSVFFDRIRLINPGILQNESRIFYLPFFFHNVEWEDSEELEDLINISRAVQQARVNGNSVESLLKWAKEVSGGIKADERAYKEVI